MFPLATAATEDKARVGWCGMAWIFVLVASMVEIGWAVGLKFTEGFTRPIPSFVVATLIVLSFFLVAQAAKEIPIGTAYGVFVGIGAGGTGLLGVFMLGEPAGLARMLSLVAIVAGVVGLKLFGEPHKEAAQKETDKPGSVPR